MCPSRSPTSPCPVPTEDETPSPPEGYELVEGSMTIDANGNLMCKTGDIYMCLDGIGTGVNADHLHCHEELKKWKTGAETLNLTQRIGCIKSKVSPAGKNCPFFVELSECVHFDGFAVPGTVSVCPHGTNATLPGHEGIRNITCHGESGYMKVGFLNGSICENKSFNFTCQGPTTSSTTTTSTSTLTTTTTAVPTTTTTKAANPPTTTTTTSVRPTSTTTVTTTTTISPRCPPGGVWGEWSTTGQCETTCGSYNVAARLRVCNEDICGGVKCPCTGPSEDVGPCGIALCEFPSKTCNAPFVKSLNNRTFQFFCGFGNEGNYPSCNP